MPSNSEKPWTSRVLPPSPVLPPRHFLYATSKDGRRFAVPKFALPGAQLDMEIAGNQQKIREEYDVPVGANPHNYAPTSKVSAGRHVACPPDPGLTEGELLDAHAAALAMVNQLGISYIDACHRLYSAGIESCTVQHEAWQRGENIKRQIQELLQNEMAGSSKGAQAQTARTPNHDAGGNAE